MVKKEALKIFSNEGGKDYDSNPEYVASNGWLRNFFNRHRITLRQNTTVCQKLLDVLAPKVSSYLLYVRSKRLKFNLTLQNMRAMDETPIWLDMAADSTVDFVGNKSVPIKTTGHEKSRVTVVLAAKANGSKLPPFIIFKGKRVDKVIVVVRAYSGNGWMNEDLTHTWLNKVWGTLAFSRRLLCWDAYRCHIQDSTKQILSKLKTDAAVIPGGCTGLLQAPDMSWNKPFKTYYREIYEDWLNDGEKATTKGGNMKPPTRVQLATWVKAAWDKVPTELIKKSFLVCGVSNAIDNSEDKDINVLKPDGILYASRDDILSKLQKLTEAKNDFSNITETVPTEEEDVEATAENEVGVDEDDGFNKENNILLAE